MTSASAAWQWGQRGSARGLFRGGWRRVLLLLEATQHGEGVLVDGAGAAAPPHRVPGLPVDRDPGRFHLELLLDPRAKVGRPHAELAFAVQGGGFAVWRPKPFDRLVPGAIEWAAVD